METDRPIWRSRAWFAAVIALLALGLLISAFGVDNPTTASVILIFAGLVATAIVVCTQLRIRAQRKRYEEELATWASERAKQNERLRIAADLHDLVSHGLGLITVRSAAAVSLAGPAAERERTKALRDIEQISRETTTELRRMLNVLRHSGSVAPLHPSDTFNALPSIVSASNTAGLAVVLDIRDAGNASPGVQLTVCAIVREALNNTLRHAGPTNVDVTVYREGSVIAVDILDEGPKGHWSPEPGAGYGLAGLRERAQALEGTLETVHTGNGFRVAARLPDRNDP